MPKAKNTESTLSSRLLEDSDEEEEAKYYKERDAERGLSPDLALELLNEFDAEGGIDKWTKSNPLLVTICEKYPDKFGCQDTNPKLFKRTKNFATRFKKHKNKPQKKAQLIKQAEAEAKKPQQQPKPQPEPTRPKKMARTPPRNRTPTRVAAAGQEGTWY